MHSKALSSGEFPVLSYISRTMKPILTISILLFAAPFLLYFCDPGDPGHSGPVYTGCPPYTPPGPFSLELERFNIIGFVDDKDGRRLDGYRVDETDAFSLQIVLEDTPPWTLAFLRKSGDVYGFPAAMACSPAPPIWIETDPLVSVDIFMVDPLAVDTISVSKYLRIFGRFNWGAAYVLYNVSDPPYVLYNVSDPPKSYALGRNAKINFTLRLLRTEPFPESAYFFGEALFSSGRILESPDTPDFLFQ